MDSSIIGEIQCDLLGFHGIEPAKAVDAHQGVINEMRPHLQDHDAGAFMRDLLLLSGNFLLLPENLPLLMFVLLNLVGQNETVHGQCGEDIADVNEGENIHEQMDGECGGCWQEGNEKSEKNLAGKLSAALYRASNINQQGGNERNQGKRIQRTAGILICRCETDITINEQDTHEEDEKD